jgi:hypothetical protein
MILGAGRAQPDHSPVLSGLSCRHGGGERIEIIDIGCGVIRAEGLDMKLDVGRIEVRACLQESGAKARGKRQRSRAIDACIQARFWLG